MKQSRCFREQKRSRYEKNNFLLFDKEGSSVLDIKKMFSKSSKQEMG